MICMWTLNSSSEVLHSHSLTNIRKTGSASKSVHSQLILLVQDFGLDCEWQQTAATSLIYFVSSDLFSDSILILWSPASPFLFWRGLITQDSVLFFGNREHTNKIFHCPSHHSYPIIWYQNTMKSRQKGFSLYLRKELGEVYYFRICLWRFLEIQNSKQ